MSVQRVNAPAKVAAKLVTADELLAMGEGRRELIYGEVIEMAPTGMEHAYFEHEISRLLGNFVKANGLGKVYTGEAGFVLATVDAAGLLADVGRG